MELHVRLATPEALYGVLAVLHARRVEVRHLRYDGRTLRVGTASNPRLVPQLARRVDVIEVSLVVPSLSCSAEGAAARNPSAPTGQATSRPGPS